MESKTFDQNCTFKFNGELEIIKLLQCKLHQKVMSPYKNLCQILIKFTRSHRQNNIIYNETGKSIFSRRF